MLNSSVWFCIMSTQPSLRCSHDILLPVFLLWPRLNHTVCFWTGQGRLEIRGNGDRPYLSVDVHHRVSAGDDRPLLTSLDIRNDLSARDKGSQGLFQGPNICYMKKVLFHLFLWWEIPALQGLFEKHKSPLAECLTFTTIKLHPSPVSMHTERAVSTTIC